MQTRTYNFYTAASQNNAASIQIVAPGYVHMICWACHFNAIADNDSLTAELAFQSTIQCNTHNSQGIVDVLRAFNNLVTSGMAQSNLNKVCNGLYIPVGVGQIIYLNTSIVGAAVVGAVMHVIER